MGHPHSTHVDFDVDGLAIEHRVLVVFKRRWRCRGKFVSAGALAFRRRAKGIGVELAVGIFVLEDTQRIRSRGKVIVDTLY